MPRYSFGKEGKNMPKNSKAKTSSSSKKPPSSPNANTSTARRSPSSSPNRIRSTTRTKMNSGSGSASAATPLNGKSSSNKAAEAAKTPSSILRSSKFGVEVKRTARADDGFADDSPFWDAAKEALTQDNFDERKTQSSPENEKGGSKEEHLSKKEQQRQRKAAKKKEKQRKRRAELLAAKRQFEKDQAAMKPNFKVGQQQQSTDEGSESNSHGGEADKSSSTPDWNQRLGQRNSRRGGESNSKPAVFSPSDLSRASTIPPTPRSRPTPAKSIVVDTTNQKKNDQLDKDNDGGEFYVTTNEHDHGLSPVREDIVVNESKAQGESKESEVEMDVEMEENIEDIVDQTSLQQNGTENNVSKPDETSFQQQHDDYSDDGGDDDYGGFELNNEPISPSPSRSSTSRMSRKSSPEEQKEDEHELHNEATSPSPSPSRSIASRRSLRSSAKEQEKERSAEEHSENDKSPEQNNEPISPSPSRSYASPTSNADNQIEEESTEEENVQDDKSSSGSESSQPIVEKKKARKKKKTTELKTPTPKKRQTRSRKVRISSQFDIGYPAGNREYTTIPATQYETEENEGNVRRSKRRKFPPLAYWKNEKVVYEANREEGPMAEIFGDMPMVAGILQAEPTPYKKREVKRKTRSKNDDGDEDDDDGRNSQKQITRVSSEVSPYDSSKLRKVRKKNLLISFSIYLFHVGEESKY